MLQLSNEIKMVVSDFDGVFTDGSVYISEKNEVQKKLNFKDIMGVSMIVKKGIDFAIIDLRRSLAVYIVKAGNVKGSQFLLRVDRQNLHLGIGKHENQQKKPHGDP